jgi:hypothetical protein
MMENKPNPSSAFAMRSAVHRLVKGYRVQFELRDGALQCEWSPKVPTGKVAKELLPHYLAARDAWLRTLEIPILVIGL